MPISAFRRLCRLLLNADIYDLCMEPTILPPSRALVPEIVMFLGDFKGIFNTFFLHIHLVSEIFGFFVIMVLSQNELRPFAFY